MLMNIGKEKLYLAGLVSTSLVYSLRNGYKRGNIKTGDIMYGSIVGSVWPIYIPMITLHNVWKKINPN